MKYKALSENTVLDFLINLFPTSSKNTLKQWIKDGRIFVDDKRVEKAQLLMLPGQTMTFRPKTRYLDGGIKLIYEDQDLLVIEKPVGILSVATHFEKKETLFVLLKNYFYPRPIHVVHRLDQDTSGIMLFAFSEKGKTGLKKLFATHALKRQYVAIIEGHLENSSGTWKSYLYEDKNYKVHTSSHASRGELAITHFEVENTSRSFSRLRLTLETGRKNQIRVHCQAAGHPIVGDHKYGAKTDQIRRLALHAASLEFKHPITGKEMKFISPIPDEFERIVATRS